VSSSALSVETVPANHPVNINPAQVEDTTSPGLLALLLIAITLFSYWPTFSNGFLNYDDNGYIVQNVHLQPGLTAANIFWSFRATIMANWHPITWISHMADIQLFGLHPWGHHATSLFLHGLNVVLLFFLLRFATGFLWRSFIVAALFALHPFNVECVAWVSERKSLLCTLFLFLALFAYGWYVHKPGVVRYSTVAILFAFGLASKPMIITLPFALLLLDYWPLARLPIPEDSENTALFFKKLWPLVLEKIPLFLLSAASAYITVFAQAQSNAIAVKGILTFPVRLANALWSYLLYILKGLWPTRLIIFYPHPDDTLPLWKPLLALAVILAFTYFCIRDRRHRYLITGWLWYLGCLVPVIGLVQVGRQAMADRYAYTPLIGIFVLAVWWIAEHSGWLPHRSELLAGVFAILLIFFGALTWRQTTYWKNSFTVFGHALKVAPVNFIAENNLGEAYLQIGQPDLAYGHFLRVTEEKPRFGLGHYNLGLILIGQKRRNEAREEFQLAIQYGQENSDIAMAYHNLGIMVLEDNQPNEAISLFSEALRLSPGKQSSYLARGLAEFRLNNFRAAEADFVEGASLAPDAAACFWVGRSREAQGNASGAIEAYRKTLELQPDMYEANKRLNALLSGRVFPFAKSEN
jgi:tetratricopeptide (TPR) repeat protein